MPAARLHKHLSFDGFRIRLQRVLFQIGVVSCIGTALMLFGTVELQAQQSAQCYAPLPAPKFEKGENDEFGIVDEIVSSGQSVFHSADFIIAADQIDFRHEQNIVEATGNVRLISKDQIIKSDSAVLMSDQETLAIGNATFELFVEDKYDPSIRYQRGRGSVEGIKIENSRSQFSSVVFTLCPEGNRDVEFVSSRLTVNSETSQAVARNAVVRYKGTPILYTPYLRMPIGSERLSGFLFPSISSSSKRGGGITVPYYFNIAPNRDATLTTSHFRKRGFHLQGEYRQLGVNSDVSFIGEYMPEDKGYSNREKRYGAAIEGKWHDGDSLYSSFDSSWVSDKSFIDDYSGKFSDQDEDFLQQNLSFSYANHGLVASAGLSKFIVSDANIERTVRRPYNRVPWVSVDYMRPILANSSISSSIEWDKFRHATNPDDRRRRLRADLSLNTRFRNAFSELGMEIGGEHLKYKLSSPSDNQSQTMSVGSTHASLDGRLFFDRFYSDSSGRRWTLEPRIKALATDSVEQGNLPNLDTSVAELDNYGRLFQDSSYIGGDRLRDSNRVGIGLSANYYDPADTSAVASVGLGRVYYPDGKTASLGTAPGALPKKSDVFFETRFENRATKIHYSALFSDETNKVSSSSLRFSNAFANNMEIMSIYRHSRNGKSLWANLLRYVPDSDWNLTLQTTRSFDPNQTEEVRLSFEHQSCCAHFNVILERERQITGSYDNSISIFFDLTPEI